MKNQDGVWKMYVANGSIQDNLDEKLGAVECGSWIVVVQCGNCKKCGLDTVSDLLGKVDKKARKPWIRK
jgi:hypothetical protein